jgi:hypothetical protein
LHARPDFRDLESVCWGGDTGALLASQGEVEIGKFFREIPKKRGQVNFLPHIPARVFKINFLPMFQLAPSKLISGSCL